MTLRMTKDGLMATERTGTIRRAGTALLIALALALPLAGCGKKSSPKPPSGDAASYPQQYPAPE